MYTFISDKRHNASAVYLVHNVDGVHTEKELLGYIAQDSFVVLAYTIGKYYVSKYNECIIFPAFSVSFDYSLEIKNIGDMHSAGNIALPKFYDFECMNELIQYKAELAFINLHSKQTQTTEEIELAQKEYNEYMNMINSAAEEFPIIDKALKASGAFGYLNYTEHEFAKNETDLEKIKNVYKMVYKSIPEDTDFDILSVLTYVLELLNKNFVK